MNILLTGATGYLGNRLGNMLLDEGHRVVALHLNHEETFACDEGKNHAVSRVYLSDVDIEAVFERERIDGIIHTATLYGRRGECPADMIRVNVIFPVRLVSLAVAHGVKFFINTDTILNKFVSPYALTKSQITEWMEMYADSMQMIDMKLDHFYGPGDKNTKFVAAVLEKLLRNDDHIDLTEGTQTRDFIYVDDVVSAYRCILRNLDKMHRGQVEVFEVGTNQKNSIRYVVEKLKDLTGATTTLNFGAIPWRKNEMLDYDVNTTKLRFLGWAPRTQIDEGLKFIVADAKGVSST